MNTLLFKRHLEVDEHISMIVHKHWLIGIKDLFWPALASAALLFSVVLFPVRGWLYIAAIGSVGSLIWLARNFFDYYLDTWIITDHGIIDLAWHGWFHRQSSRVLYSDIQGVNYEIQGVTGTMFRYGTIATEKISTGSTISLSHVSNPRRVEMLILKNMEAYLHSKNLKDAKHVQELLAAYVANEVQLQGLQNKKKTKKATSET